MPSKRERLVFISHSSRDTWVARQVAEKIHERGARTFLDANDLRAGYPFAEVIREALQNADELVVLLTPWAVDRFFIAMEIGCAWLKGIPIVQLLYGLSFTDLSNNSNYPGMHTERQMLLLDDLDGYLDELEGRIGEGKGG